MQSTGAVSGLTVLARVEADGAELELQTAQAEVA